MLTNLKRIRLEKGMKAIDLAAEIGVSPSYITLMEKGRIPTVEVKKRIAKALSVAVKKIW